MQGDNVEGLETPQDGGKDPRAVAAYWVEQLNAARSGPYKRWIKASKKATKRFRDEELDHPGDARPKRNAQFNVLWSNVCVTAPSIYGKPPVPITERRFLDKDIVARAASTILQRSLAYQIEESELHETMRQCRTDFMLTAWCSAWVRYEAQYAPAAPLMQMPQAQAADDEAGPGEPQPQQGADEVLKDERLCVDYKHWSDVLVSPARFWSEVTSNGWIAVRAHFTRNQLKRAFGDQIGRAVPLQKASGEGKNVQITERQRHVLGRAEVWQIWDFDSRQTLWICEAHEVGPLKAVPDFMELKGFAPAARPARGTTTNDTVWPIPDYEMWYDQAREMDSLTARIAALTRAIKACGVFDGSIPEIARLLQEGMENKLLATGNWAGLSQKGGLVGAISLLPIKEFADALTALIAARAVVKQDLYEISGTSDIMRGATNPNETLGAQKLKGQFSGVRLTDRRDEFNRFVRDTLGIMAEIICEFFSRETIRRMSDFDQWAAEQDLKAWALQRFPPAPPPMMGHNGGPPLDPAMAGAMMPPPPAANVNPQQPNAVAPDPAQSQPAAPPPEPMPSVSPEQAIEALFDEALGLLRDEHRRSFRIDVETDSTIQMDMEVEKQQRTEFITAITQFLAQAGEMAMTMPQLMPVLGKMLLFGARGFRVGRELESSLEALIADLEKQARNPQPAPDPEQQKMELEKQKAEMQMQGDQQKHALEIQKMQAELQMQREQMELEREKMQMQLQMEQQKLALAQQKAQIDISLTQQKGQLQAEAQEREAQMGERQAQIQAEGMEREAEYDERAMERDEQHAERKQALAERAARQKASGSGGAGAVRGGGKAA